MCNKAGFPQKPQTMWKVGVLISILLTVLETFDVVSLLRSDNKIDNALGKSRVPLLVAKATHTLIFYQAVFTCNLYSRVLPTMFFSLVVQLAVHWFASMLI